MAARTYKRDDLGRFSPDWVYGGKPKKKARKGRRKAAAKKAPPKKKLPPLKKPSQFARVITFSGGKRQVRMVKSKGYAKALKKYNAEKKARARKKAM